MKDSALSHHHVIGIMSGTSLDGLDLAYCVFKEKEKKRKNFNDFKDLNIKREKVGQEIATDKRSWSYEVHKAVTVSYPEELSQRLAQSMMLSGYDIALLHNELGRYIGQQVKEFMTDFADKVDLVASHGHTVFHRSDLGMTLQIGSGAHIAAICGKPVVCDFRTIDVALGGQGAPLVPIGDELLYGQYDICLNLGGISNLSYRHNGKRKAYDISPGNIVLNHLARQMGKTYDADGEIARNGHVDSALLKQFNQLDYYKQLKIKSLGREWIDSEFFPILNSSHLSVPDQMRTVCEHIAEQIANACNTTGGKNLLITGGGAHNTFLIDLIRQKFDGQVIIPDDKTIDFKEAIIFAFLGFLRINGMTNCLASVTGASQDTCGGALYNVSDCVSQEQDPGRPHPTNTKK